jgi:hypothetical protein
VALAQGGEASQPRSVCHVDATLRLDGLENDCGRAVDTASIVIEDRSEDVRGTVPGP